MTIHSKLHWYGPLLFRKQHFLLTIVCIFWHIAVICRMTTAYVQTYRCDMPNDDWVYSDILLWYAEWRLGIFWHIAVICRMTTAYIQIYSCDMPKDDWVYWDILLWYAEWRLRMLSCIAVIYRHFDIPYNNCIYSNIMLLYTDATKSSNSLQECGKLLW